MILFNFSCIFNSILNYAHFKNVEVYILIVFVKTHDSAPNEQFKIDAFSVLLKSQDEIFREREKSEKNETKEE